MKIVAGLGNPGREYAGTRHNVGFRVLDRLVERLAVGFDAEKYRGLVAEARRGGERILFVKPLTFMNLSGDCVARAVRYRNVAPGDLLVVLDDVNLPLGRLRLRGEGSAGGHNGLKSIIVALGTDAFPRLRLGVGAARPGGELVNHVLGRFAPDEIPEANEMVDRAAESVLQYVDVGLERAMSEINRSGEK